MSAESEVYVASASQGTLGPLLARLRSSPSGSSGAWRLGTQGRDVGVVLMERGRVCWAAAVGLQRRLTDIIVEKHGIDRQTIEEVYSACRTRAEPLGECLVGRGLLTADALEVVLMEHTSEAIRHVARLGPDSALWIPHNKQGYAPRFTFSMLSIFTGAAALASGINPRKLHQRLEAISNGETPIIAYATDAREGFPIGLVCQEELDVDALMELGSWARGSLQSLARMGTGARVVCASTSRGVLVTSDGGDIVIAALCADGTALARFLAQLARGDHGHLRPQ